MDPAKELAKTQSERQGPQGTYQPDEVKAFELGAKYVFDLVIGTLSKSPRTPAHIIDEIKTLRGDPCDITILVLPGLEQVSPKLWGEQDGEHE